MRNKLFVFIPLLIVGIIALVFLKNSFFVSGDSKKMIRNASFTKIDVKSENALLEIIPTDSSTATVEVIQKKKKRSYALNASVKGDTLSVKLKEKGFGFIQFGFNSPPALIIKIPQKEYESILAKSNNGKIVMKNLKADNIELSTDNGKIDLSNTDASTINLKTANGKIDMNDVEGILNAKTNTGKISLVTAHLDREIDFKTDVGKIIVETEKEPTNTTIEVKTSVGSVDVFGLKNKEMIFGDGKYYVKLKTEVGKTVVKKVE